MAPLQMFFFVDSSYPFVFVTSFIAVRSPFFFVDLMGSCIVGPSFPGTKAFTLDLNDLQKREHV